MSLFTEMKSIKRELISANKMEALLQLPALQEGARLLQQGEVVAFPTETVYGLGANAYNEEAVKKIFQAKGRPQDNPLIVHIASRQQLSGVIAGEISPLAEKLMAAFWPGPLTLIFPKSSFIPTATTAGLDSVAVRMPSHPVAQALIKLADLPVAAPSANISGAPSPTRAEHVFNDLQGRIPLIIDGGPSPVGLESTVVDVRQDKPLILRPGGVSQEAIEELLGIKLTEKTSLSSAAETPVSPGMKYRHYAPETPLYLCSREEGEKIEDLISRYDGQKVALVLTSQTAQKLSTVPANVSLIIIGSQEQPAGIAARLFALLRELDQANYDLIIMESIPEKGLGRAVMNRLYKASRRE